MATTCGREKAMYLVFCRSRQNKERINEQNETDARSPHSLTMKSVLQFSAAFPKITKWRSRHVGPVQRARHLRVCEFSTTLTKRKKSAICIWKSEMTLLRPQ